MFHMSLFVSLRGYVFLDGASRLNIILLVGMPLLHIMHFVRGDDLVRVFEIPIQVDIFDGHARERQRKQANHLLKKTRISAIQPGKKNETRGRKGGALTIPARVRIILP